MIPRNKFTARAIMKSLFFCDEMIYFKRVLCITRMYVLVPEEAHLLLDATYNAYPQSNRASKSKGTSFNLNLTDVRV